MKFHKRFFNKCYVDLHIFNPSIIQTFPCEIGAPRDVYIPASWEVPQSGAGVNSGLKFGGNPNDSWG